MLTRALCALDFRHNVKSACICIYMEVICMVPLVKWWHHCVVFVQSYCFCCFLGIYWKITRRFNAEYKLDLE